MHGCKRLPSKCLHQTYGRKHKRARCTGKGINEVRGYVQMSSQRAQQLQMEEHANDLCTRAHVHVYEWVQRGWLAVSLTASLSVATMASQPGLPFLLFTGACKKVPRRTTLPFSFTVKLWHPNEPSADRTPTEIKSVGVSRLSAPAVMIN